MFDLNLLWPVGLAFAASLLILGGLLHSQWGRRLALDQPNQRSLHTVAVPRVGGIAIVPGALLAWSLTPAASPLLASLIAVLALISAIDDRRGLPASLRLGVHCVVALVFALSLGLPLAWLTGALMLYLVWMSNCYNFMDGADGLAGGMALFGFGAYGIAAHLAGEAGVAVMSFSLAASAMAFLFFNFAPARVFMGDAGSISLGFAAAALGAIGVQKALCPAWFPLLVFSPFCVDASLTLGKRIWRGERFWQAHREHYYQRLVRMGWSHGRTALCAYALMLGTAASALLGMGLGDFAQRLMLLAWALIYAILLRAIDRRWQRARLGENG